MSSRAVKLAYSSYPCAVKAAQGPPLIAAHGMFGNRRNLDYVSRAISRRGWTVISSDMRNHGQSPHSEVMDYSVMSEDLALVISEQGLTQANVLGHSMGGKAAMVLALSQPHLVSRLVVVDVAPSPRPSHFSSVIPAVLSAMRTCEFPVELRSLSAARSLASQHLAPTVPDRALRDFLVSNVISVSGHYTWRLNLHAMHINLDALLGFPDLAGPYQGDTLFIRGDQSTHISDCHTADIRRLFPRSHIESVAGAGHMVHADQPQTVISLVTDFLQQPDS